jgi:hypothetical protein
LPCPATASVTEPLDSAAVPAATVAAPFKNPRRETGPCALFDLAISGPPENAIRILRPRRRPIIAHTMTQ